MYQQKWYKYRARRGLELPASPLLAATELPPRPAHDQPLSPPTPPRTAYEFPEPQDTTGQARRRGTTGSSAHMGLQGLCMHACMHTGFSLSQPLPLPLLLAPPPL